MTAIYGHEDVSLNGNGHARADSSDSPDSVSVPDLSTLPLSPAAWLARDLAPPDFLMGELFSTTSRVLLAADTGLGKSMIAMALGLSMALGRDFLRWRCRRPARVLILDGEMPRDLLQERIRAACGWLGIDPPKDGIFILSREDVEEHMPPLDTEDGGEWLLRVVQTLQVEFVILDNVMSLTEGDLREETTWRRLVPLSRELSRKKVGQLWLHHVGHDKTRAYGSRLFSWQMDAVLMGEAVHDKAADVSVKLTCQKARRRTPDNREDFATVHVKLQDGAWTAEEVLEDRTGPDSPRRRPLSPTGKIAVEALRKAIDSAGERPPHHDQTAKVDRAVRLSTWKLYFEQTTSYGQDEKGRDALRKAWDRGHENARANGPVMIWGEHAWLTS